MSLAAESTPWRRGICCREEEAIFGRTDCRDSEAVAGRESAAEEAGGESDVGPNDAAGRFGKKILKPPRRRQVI